MHMSGVQKYHKIICICTTDISINFSTSISGTTGRKKRNFSRFNKGTQYYIKHIRHQNIIPWWTDQNWGKKKSSLLQVSYFLEFSFIPFWITFATFVASTFSKWKTQDPPTWCSIYQLAKEQGLPTFQAIHAADLPWIWILRFNSCRLTLPLC